jgi:hypothetical protein
MGKQWDQNVMARHDDGNQAKGSTSLAAGSSAFVARAGEAD